jgi:hypothetical protein
MIKKIRKYKPKQINVVKLKNYLEKMYNKNTKK